MYIYISLSIVHQLTKSAIIFSFRGPCRFAAVILSLTKVPFIVSVGIFKELNKVATTFSKYKYIINSASDMLNSSHLLSPLLFFYYWYNNLVLRFKPKVRGVFFK